MRLQLTIIIFLLTIAGAKSQTYNQEVWVRFEDTTKKLYGFKDLNGNIKVSPRYWDCPTDTFRTIAFVGDEKEGWVCIDKKLNKLFQPYIWDNSIDQYQSGLIRIQENKKIGFADTVGNIIIPPIYDFATPFDGKFAGFYSGGKYICLEKGLSDSQCEHKGWVDGLWGFINKANDTLVPPTFTHKEIVDMNIASLTAKNPNSDSYIMLAGNGKTYYMENVRKTFETFFTHFLKQVESKNTSYLKSVCYANVKCTYCLLNTKEEYDSLVKAKLYFPGSFYTETRNNENVPTKKFINEDFNFVFSKHAIANLRDTSKTENFIDQIYYRDIFYFTNDSLLLHYLDKQQRYFEITTVINHSKNGKPLFQEHYEFLKTEEGVKFIGYDRTLDGYGE